MSLLGDSRADLGIARDQKGTVWFTEMTKTGAIREVDPVTLKVTKYIPPTRERPRRIQVDTDGVAWFAEYEDSRIGRFDPEKESFKEFPLPHRESMPFALGIERTDPFRGESYRSS
jgi:virginiamycin B lyase